MADPKPDVLDAGHQVFVLAFDLVDAEIERLPEHLAKTLVSPPVQDAIKKTLLDFAKSKQNAAGTVVSGEEAKKLVESLQKGVTGAAGDELLKTIKKTPEYLKLESSIDAFKKAAASSTLGVWVDKNKGILYVVGAALVVGTASVLYVTKTGGSVLNTVLDPLEGKKFEVLKIGKLTIKAGLWDFQPDARILGARVFGTAQWQRIKLDLKFGLLAEEATIKQVQGEAAIKSGPVSVSFTADAKPQVQTVNLGLKVDYKVDKFNLGLGAMYKDSQVSGTASASYQTKHAAFGLQGNVGPKQGGGSGPQYSALFTVTIPIN
jgi:hypothetical protein